MNTCIYYGGCWSTNVGNAFIDFGSMHLCKKYNSFLYSEMDYLMFKNRRQNYYNTLEALKPKCVIFSGMVTCPQFIIDQKEIFEIIDRMGIPVVFNGVGGEEFTHNEIRVFREFIKRHKFAGFISRDDESFNAYHDLFPKSYRGIDVGFFMSESDQFKNLNGMEKIYTVVNNDDLGFTMSPDVFPEYVQGISDNSIIYTHHQLTNMPSSYIDTSRMMLSELPYQFVYMYALSKATFSTRVHACVATLSFGGKCVLLYKTPRSSLFVRVGCENITKGFCSVNKDLFESRKAEHRQAFDEIMSDIM